MNTIAKVAAELALLAPDNPLLPTREEAHHQEIAMRWLVNQWAPEWFARTIPGPGQDGGVWIRDTCRSLERVDTTDPEAMAAVGQRCAELTAWTPDPHGDVGLASRIAWEAVEAELAAGAVRLLVGVADPRGVLAGACPQQFPLDWWQGGVSLVWMAAQRGSWAAGRVAAQRALNGGAAPKDALARAGRRILEAPHRRSRRDSAVGCLRDLLSIAAR